MIIEMRTYFPPFHARPSGDRDEDPRALALRRGELEATLMPMIEKYDVTVVEAEGGLGEWK